MLGRRTILTFGSVVLFATGACGGAQQPASIDAAEPGAAEASANDSAGTSAVRRAKNRNGALGATTRFMPRRCSKARAYLDGERLFAGDIGAAFDELESAFVSGISKGDTERVRQAAEVGAQRGLTIASVGELAVCVDVDKRYVAALAFDEAKTKGRLDDGIHALLEAASGDTIPVTREQGVTIFVVKGDSLVLTDDGVLVFGLPKDDMVAIAASPDESANGFEEASRFVAWLKYEEESDTEVTFTIQDGKEGYRVRGVFPPPEWMRDDFAANPEESVAKLRDRVQSLSSKIPAESVKTLGPIVRATEVAVDGNEVAMSTTVQPIALTTTLRLIARDPEALKKALAH